MMSSFSLKGYEINFPYPVPYDIQKVYMSKVLDSLDKKSHAVLESPTGTGKTLCLFAPVTAWAKRIKAKSVPHVSINTNLEVSSQYFENKESQGPWGSKIKPKVWYTARTHSQIAQTVNEVRKCDIEGLHVRVMGARDQLCINEQVLEEKDSYVKTVKCKELVKGRHCKYYNKLSHEKDFHRFYQSGEVLDIEDLINVGKSCGVCPYFLAKKASESADIILLPYNYIIDRESRESNSFFLQNDVVIFDEGHNIPSTCEESYEFSFSSLDIAIGIKNVQEVMLGLTRLTDSLIEDEEIDVAKHASNSMMMVEVLQKLESALSTLPTSSELLPVSRLYKFFGDAGVDEKKSKELVEGIAAFKSDSGKLSLTSSTLETFNLLEKMMSTIFGSTVKSFSNEVIEKSFKFGVTVDPERQYNVKKLSLFCFNPSFGIKSLLLLGVQSIIITSGTLSPLNTFIAELGLPNPETLENSHIAKKCQVPFVILGTGVNNVKMDGAYKNRNDPKYVTSLGMTLTNLIGSVPDGVLLLFSSYTMMQNLKESWESDLGIWTRLNSLKRVFVEPRKKDEFINCMENYKRAIDSGNGAILMGVLRGKISEGMDFKDQYCRGVFIIGVPFPPVQDPRVKGKEKYAESLVVFNSNTGIEEKLYSNSFMSIEAMKATNQAIGRVIRHGQDYGVIVLVDYRFAWPRLFQNISGWLRDDVAIESNFPTTKKLITDFFRNIYSAKLGVEEVRCQQVDKNGCPVASCINFEEYDHKKQKSQPGPWIGLTPRDQQNTKSRIGERKVGKGHSNVEFVDDNDLDMANILSFYKNSKSKTLKEDPSIESPKKAGSLLDALESSRCNSVGYRDEQKTNLEQSSDTNKRKYEDDGGTPNSKNPCMKLSPSLFSSPESSQSSQPKKVTRLKVRPLLPREDDSEEQIYNPSKLEQGFGDNNLRNKEAKEKEIKAKMIAFYREVRQLLSKEGDLQFKTTSSKYMKGEVTIAEVIKLMDTIFLSSGNKNLFSGFSICVKSRDKAEWINACRSRKVDLS